MANHVTSLHPGVFRRKFGRIMVCIIGCVTASYVSYSYISGTFIIRTIQVVGTNTEIRINNEKIPKNLLFFPADRIRSEVLHDNALLSDVIFEKVYPGTLRVRPIFRTPFIRLLTGDRNVIVDHDGIVLMEGDQRLSLPTVTLPSLPVMVGEKLQDSSLRFLLQFLTGIQSFISVDTITPSDGTYYLVKTGKTDIFITQDKPITDTLNTLQMLITGFRIKGTLPAVVDLRFDKPIIKN